ncbi:MAG: BrnT family toxin [Acidobacteria bacterium]|nr:BrnT family toxin [Acidobacteriota bacterium]
MKFEWDVAKCQTNLAKHGIDFADVGPLFDGVTVTMPDDRFDYGEERFVTLGLLNGFVLVVVHTETDKVIRLISVRKATKNEEKSYFNEIAN